MKRIFNSLSGCLYLAIILAVNFTMTSCLKNDSNEPDNVRENKKNGKVIIEIGVEHSNSKLRTTSSSYSPDMENLREATRLIISSDKGVVKEYQKLAEIPSEISLQTGEYEATAIANEDIQSSFSAVGYKGIKPFTIQANQSTNVQLHCQVDGILVRINRKDLDNYQKIEVKTFIDSRHPLVFSTTDGSIDQFGFFRIPFQGGDLSYSFKGTTANGQTTTMEGSPIKNLKKNHIYTLNFQKEVEADNVGVTAINVSVDTQPIKESESVITIFQMPQIKADGVNINQPIGAEPGKIPAINLQVKAAQKLTAFVISSADFSRANLQGEYNLIALPDNLRNTLKNAGLTFEYLFHEESQTAQLNLELSSKFLNTVMEGEGMHTIHIRLVAGNGNTSQVIDKDIVINASTSVITNQAQLNAEDIWATKAILRGELMKEMSGKTLIFKYRKQGAEQWSEIMANLQGNSLSAEINHLVPHTSYEFKAAIRDGDESQSMGRFTTTEETQLPNSGFESWYNEKKYWSPNASASNIFWDTANKGTTILKESGTIRDQSVKHSGTYSAKIFSQDVTGMAAGTLYTGEFKKVMIFPKGANLTFGRPFTTRPSSMSGWFKYRPGIVDKTSSSKPNVKTGDLDEGIIYVILGDWDQPVEISTAQKKFIDVQNDPHIIAYGERIFTGKSEGEGLISFNFPLTYRSSRIPKYIIVVSTCSRNGDYFVGSTHSILWLDDLKLNYE